MINLQLTQVHDVKESIAVKCSDEHNTDRSVLFLPKPIYVLSAVVQVIDAILQSELGKDGIEFRSVFVAALRKKA